MHVKDGNIGINSWSNLFSSSSAFRLKLFSADQKSILKFFLSPHSPLYPQSQEEDSGILLTAS